MTLPKAVRLLIDEQFWNDFKTYLINYKNSQSGVRGKMSYAKRFYHTLERKDASSLITLTPDVKSYIMRAIAALSKSGECMIVGSL